MDPVTSSIIAQPARNRRSLSYSAFSVNNSSRGWFVINVIAFSADPSSWKPATISINSNGLNSTGQETANSALNSQVSSTTAKNASSTCARSAKK